MARKSANRREPFPIDAARLKKLQEKGQIYGRITGHPELAEDFTQEAALAAVRGWRQTTGQASYDTLRKLYGRPGQPSFDGRHAITFGALSLDVAIPGTEELLLGDTLVDPRRDPRDELELRGAERYTRGLTEIETAIIDFYFFDELSLREIGDRLGVTESRVSQRLANILRKMRRSFSVHGGELTARGNMEATTQTHSEMISRECANDECGKPFRCLEKSLSKYCSRDCTPVDELKELSPQRRRRVDLSDKADRVLGTMDKEPELEADEDDVRDASAEPDAAASDDIDDAHDEPQVRTQKIAIPAPDNGRDGVVLSDLLKALGISQAHFYTFLKLGVVSAHGKNGRAKLYDVEACRLAIEAHKNQKPKVMRKKTGTRKQASAKVREAFKTIKAKTADRKKQKSIAVEKPKKRLGRPPKSKAYRSRDNQFLFSLVAGTLMIIAILAAFAKYESLFFK